MNQAGAFAIRAAARKAFIAALRADGLGSRDRDATARQFREARQALDAANAQLPCATVNQPPTPVRSPAVRSPKVAHRRDQSRGYA